MTFPQSILKHLEDVEELEDFGPSPARAGNCFHARDEKLEFEYYNSLEHFSVFFLWRTTRSHPPEDFE